MNAAPVRVLVVEDGHEYSEVLGTFLGPSFVLARAGDGEAALRHLASEPTDVVFLDMRFDRAALLLGDLPALVQRFGGDARRARAFLEDHQGTFILAALRAAGQPVPVVLSYDFDLEPQRFQTLAARHGPLSFVPSSAGPAAIRAALRAAAARLR